MTLPAGLIWSSGDRSLFRREGCTAACVTSIRATLALRRLPCRMSRPALLGEVAS